MLTAYPLAEIFVMLAVLVAGFVAMVQFQQSQALVMPLVASVFLALQGHASAVIARESFTEFATVALVFTAVAVPAHQIEKSGLFERIGAWLGSKVGLIGPEQPRRRIPVFVATILIAVWITAGCLHNITSVLIWTPITIMICASYDIRSHGLLCGVLVASNLGGFSTAWGDTPNIIERQVWQLEQSDFFIQILPVNFLIILVLISVVSCMTVRNVERVSTGGPLRSVLPSVDWMLRLRETRLDKRRLIVGSIALFGFIARQLINHEIEIAAAGGAIAFALLGERSDDRVSTLHALGLDVYSTLVAVFIIAHSISHSTLGAFLGDLITSTDGALWAIAVSSYLGTAFTEAASWASASAQLIHTANPGTSAAWAMGGGICAGSSSILTAASAGIVLWNQTKRFPGHEITFRSYLWFGLSASLLMLLAYVWLITLGLQLGFYS